MIINVFSHPTTRTGLRIIAREAPAPPSVFHVKRDVGALRATSVRRMVDADRNLP